MNRIEIARLDADHFAREVAAAGGRVLTCWEEDEAVYVQAQSGALRHLLATKPGLGREHHAVVGCALRSPVALGVIGDQTGRAGWTAGAEMRDADVEAWIGRQHALAALASRLPWTGVVEEGRDPVVFAWLLQLRATADGRGHLVVRTGYGDGRLPVVELVKIAERVANVIPPAPQANHAFVVDPAFLETAETVLGIGEPRRRPPLASDVAPAPASRNAGGSGAAGAADDEDTVTVYYRR